MSTTDTKKAKSTLQNEIAMTNFKPICAVQFWNTLGKLAGTDRIPHGARERSARHAGEYPQAHATSQKLIDPGPHRST